MQEVKLFLKFFFCNDVFENGFLVSDFNQAVLKSDLDSERLRIIFHELGVFGNNEHGR